MADPPSRSVPEWAEAIRQLHDHLTREQTDARLAAHAATNLWKDFGFRGGPPEIATMIRQAIEIGYAAATRDVRDGDLDDLIEVWQSTTDDD